MSYTTSTVVSFGDPDAQPRTPPLGLLLLFSAAIATPGAGGSGVSIQGLAGVEGAPSDIVNDDGICSSDGDTQDGLCIDGTYIGIRRDTDTIETMCTRYCD